MYLASYIFIDTLTGDVMENVWCSKYWEEATKIVSVFLPNILFRQREPKNIAFIETESVRHVSHGGLSEQSVPLLLAHKPLG